MWFKKDNDKFYFNGYGVKIIICEMCVERLVDEWIATSSPMFATAWPGFHKFARGSSLMTFFTGSKPVAGLALFA